MPDKLPYYKCTQCDGTWCVPGPVGQACPNCRPAGKKKGQLRMLNIVQTDELDLVPDCGPSVRTADGVLVHAGKMSVGAAWTYNSTVQREQEIFIAEKGIKMFWDNIMSGGSGVEATGETLDVLHKVMENLNIRAGSARDAAAALKQKIAMKRDAAIRALGLGGADRQQESYSSSRCSFARDGCRRDRRGQPFVSG